MRKIISALSLTALLAGLMTSGTASADSRSFARQMTTTPHQGSRATYVPATPPNINRMNPGQRVIVTGPDGISTRTGTVVFHPYGGNRISYDR